MNRPLQSLLPALVAMLVACGPSDPPAGETARDHALAHAQPGYVCPMHPQMTSDEPGSCPVCGMDLVKRKSETTEGDVQRVLSYRHPHPPMVSSTPSVTTRAGATRPVDPSSTR